MDITSIIKLCSNYYSHSIIIINDQYHYHDEQHCYYGVARVGGSRHLLRTTSRGGGGRGMADHESELSQQILGFSGFRVEDLGFLH